MALPGDQVPLPGAGPEAAAVPTGMVTLPTADGGEVLVPEAPKKVIMIGDKEQEVDSITTEERDQRRLVRSLIMGGIGVLALAIIAIMLVYFGRGHL